MKLEQPDQWLRALERERGRGRGGGAWVEVHGNPPILAGRSGNASLKDVCAPTFAGIPGNASSAVS